MIYIENEEPYTDDEEKLAESIVDETLAPLRRVVSPEVLDALREEMVDELLATRAGRCALESARVERVRRRATLN